MLSLIVAPITALLSMIISYLVVKRKFKSKGFIEAVSMLAMAVPGTVLDVGYIRGYSGGLFHSANWPIFADAVVENGKVVQEAGALHGLFPSVDLITVQINEFAEKGAYSIACAFATILILITYGSVLLMNLLIKYFGTSKKIKED